jgi:outer membrane protein assembly factor BamB
MPAITSARSRIPGPCTLLTALAVLVFHARPLLAEWPEFRGGAAQGVARQGGLPLTWGDHDHIAWRVPTEGLGWSSPAVMGERIYLTTAVPRGDDVYDLTAECRRLSDGTLVWREVVQRQTGKVEIHSKNSHASPSPLVSGERVYVHFGPHATACLNAVDGRLIWKTRLEYKPQHGTGGSPALFEDVLIVCCDGRDVQYVVGLDAATGRERWRTPRDTNPRKGFSFSTPLVIQAGGRWQAICPGSDAVFAYDPRLGRELWRCRYEDGYSVVPRPVYAEGLLFVCTGYDRPKILAIDPTGSGDVTDSHVRWVLERGAPHNPSPVVCDGALYCVSDKGIVTCVDARSGVERWQERLGGNYSASPLVANGRLYLQDEAGVCHVLAAAPSFQLLATNKWAEGERTYASFAVAGRSLILRSESELVRVDP